MARKGDGLMVFPVRLGAETILDLDWISAAESATRQERERDPRAVVTRGELARRAILEFVERYKGRRGRP